MCRAFAVIVTVLFAAGQARAETLETFKKKIHDKVSAYKSMQYKTHMTSEMVNPQISYKMSTDQTSEFVNKGDTCLMHTESKSSAQQKIGDINQNTTTSSTDVCDGKFYYSVTDASGQKTAAKRKYDPKTQPSPFDPMAGFKMIEQHFNLKLLPDETVDGKGVYVLEMTLKDAQAGMPIASTRLYYDKSTGIAVKSVSLDDKGKTVGTMTTTDIKIDASIPPERFVFKVPVGVDVVDETKGA